MPSDYGILGMLNNGYALITIILVFALDNSTARWFYDTDDNQDRKHTINTWIWFYLLFSLILAGILYFLAPFFSDLFLNGSKEGVVYIRILSVSLPLMMWMGVANNVLRFERKAIQAVSLTIFYSLTIIGLNILFVLYLKMGLMGAYYAQFGAAAGSMIVSIYLLRGWIGSYKLFEMTRLRSMIRYSLPFVPASLAFWLVNLSGVFFVNALLSESEAGLFQIGSSIAAVSGLITNAFQQAWAPFAFSVLNQENAKQIYAKIFELYIMVVGLFCTMVALFSPEILILLTTSNYYGASWVASILTLSYLLMGLTNIADLGASVAKKTAPLGFISVISAICLLLLNYLLIPIIGKEGAALSICCSQLMVPIYMFYKSQKLFYIPFNFKKGLSIIVFLVILSVIGLIVKGEWWQLIIYKLLLLGGVLLFFYYQNREDAVRVINLVKSKFMVAKTSK